MAESKAAAASNYLQQTKITDGLQEDLTKILNERPEDPFGALSKLLKKRALPPVIDHVKGREVLDSRGNPTVEVDVYAKYLGDVIFAGRSSSPSGASTGSGEAMELRDGDNRYNGKGTKKAVANVDTAISEALKGKPFDSLQELDNALIEADGTELKTKLGGNATTATSFALAEAAANLEETQLFLYLARQYYGGQIPEGKKFHMPAPFFNILNGGKHAGGNLKLQEFMINPNPAKYQFPDQLRVAAEVYQKLGQILSKVDISYKNLGDEGGYAPKLESPDEALNYIETAIKEAGYQPVEDVRIALDAASSEFYNTNQEHPNMYEVEVGNFKTGEEMIQYWKDLVEKHPAIISIEDGLDEKDYETWAKLNEALGDKIHLVGDDLYTTNPKTIAKGLEGKWCNALLLKVNQIGTISEGMQAARLILEKDQWVMVSHRSGETANSVIADLAVGIGAQAIKTGSCARGERIQKYTRLLQIYEYLQEHNLLE
ncbi:enolase family protein [Trichomonas vaginalis G3]|uniref:phosphopyruvate hydratase n=1 Tax=Trichomonas vaginalis (strain ATCC PRA-98 / G3) TaxID=412133 RepID=A2EFN8_TRIV3|nr:enolase family [Trichomonas vaginalis G3]EAY08533.1 enolase family protein [Trichomonas vaginalis G3]KAI5542094.1 enolase family [Trichomonas vaginalis G3]|eukprot:XP_001320756.1 enolase family protein [Trichomonas vaginalis G3]